MKDINRWLKKGLIDENLAQILRHELEVRRQNKYKCAVQITLYTIGAILLGISIISFIAANDWILAVLKSLRVLQPYLLLILTVTSLLGGYYFAYEKKNCPGLGNCLIFLSTILIGANYAFLTQHYNIVTDNSIIYWLWFVSIFPLAFIFKSRAINWLSIILFITAFCSLYVHWDCDNDMIWILYMPFIIGSILYTFANTAFVSKNFHDFAVSYKLTAILPIFFTLLILVFVQEKSYYSSDIHYLLLPIILLLVNAYSYLLNKSKDKYLKLETGFVAGVTTFMFLLLICPEVNPAMVALLAHMFIIYLLWGGFDFGYKFENVSLINLINLMITIYVMSIYGRYGWTYMNKTLFFFAGGAILIGLGLYLEKYKRSQISSEGK